ncbi:MAG: type II toxin-antitoxin system VapC family toxin [Desulfobacterales bacterium]
MHNDLPVIYWDASAVLSTLFKDRHSERAITWAEAEGVHFISTLAYSEVCAVIARMKKERILSSHLVSVSFEMLEQGPWRRLTANPEWGITKNLSKKWSLRGADLWHLATAKSLQKEIPELIFVTFDARLQQAAQGEKFSTKITRAG